VFGDRAGVEWQPLALKDSTAIPHDLSLDGYSIPRLFLAGGRINAQEVRQRFAALIEPYALPELRSRAVLHRAGLVAGHLHQHQIADQRFVVTQFGDFNPGRGRAQSFSFRLQNSDAHLIQARFQGEPFELAESGVFSRLELFGLETAFDLIVPAADELARAVVNRRRHFQVESM